MKKDNVCQQRKCVKSAFVEGICRAFGIRSFEDKIKGLLDTCILRYLRFYLFSPAARTLQDVLKEGLKDQ